MALKGRYLIELSEKSLSEASTGLVCARLEGDSALRSAAKDRVRYSRNDRWWSVPGGIMLIGFFAVYSAGYTTAALCIAAVMAIYLAAVLSWMAIKRLRLRRVAPELSPQRGAEALWRMALGMPPRGRDVTRLFADEPDKLGAVLKNVTAQLAKECGVDIRKWTLDVSTALGSMFSPARDVAVIPLSIYAVGSGEGGECEFIFEYAATFACAATGDCLPVCGETTVENVTFLKDTFKAAGEVEFVKCEGCGVIQSRKALRTRESVCRRCGAHIK